MNKYVWCEDSRSGFEFWKELFGTLYPDFIVETKNSNTKLRKAVDRLSDDGNLYYIIMDTAIDNPDILREIRRLKAAVTGKNNIRIIKVHSFEFSLLSFEHLEDWVFAVKDELRDKRSTWLEARNIFVKLITKGGNADELSEFKQRYDFSDKKNSEMISAKLLYEITKNTGFETDKSKVGECFVKNCCEWEQRQEDDICGLDDSRITVSEKMSQLKQYSVLQEALREAGL